MGKAILTATADGKSNSMELEVSDKTVIDITPVITELAKGDSVQFEASEQVAWAVKGDIGEIDNKGIFTATTEGEGKIVATLLDDPTVTSTTVTLKVTPPKRIKTALSLTLPDKTRYLQPLTLTGELLLTQQTELKPTNLEVAISLTSPTDEVQEYQANTDQQGRYQVKAPIQLDEVGNWQAQLSFAGNGKLAPSQRPWTIKVEKGVAEFSLLSPAKAELGDNYPLQIALDPKLVDKAVNLKILQPDDQVINLSATTGAESTLQQSFKLERAGNWTVTAIWGGDDYYQPLTQTFEINVIKRYGKVVMVLAGSDPSRESEWDKFHGIAQMVHQTFVSRRFDAKEDIYFLSTAPNQTANADGQTTLQNLQFAINTWAGEKVNANVPLYLYLLSHNLEDKFVIQSDVFLTPTQLDVWLDELAAETPVTIIIEACYSGNFIGSALSAPNRTIITSASDDQQAMITRTSSFSRHFFQQQIARNTTVAEAFEKSMKWTERTALHRSQRPQLDANGNGDANEKQDYRALGQRRIPADIQSLSLAPEFVTSLEPVKLEAGVKSHSWQVELSTIKADQVSATIIPPDLNLEQGLTSWQQIDQALVEVELEPLGDNIYQLSYDGFQQAGDYTVMIQASNQDGVAAPIQTTVSVGGSLLKGDVNSDGTVNIFDLVMVAGSFGQTGDNLKGDADGNGTVNIFDLVTVAGNFGQSSLAAPASVASEIELTTEQKHHIAIAIDQLAAQPERSSAEEMVLGVLQAILPERLPSQTQLLANYPNPFNPETWIPFQLSQDTEVIVTIYDVLGELVRQLELGMVRAGRYVTAGQAAYWDGKTEVGEAVSSGTYFYQLKAGDYTETRKMVILK